MNKKVTSVETIEEKRKRTNKNLKTITSSEMARELGRKGGHANLNNPRQKYAARIRWLKRKNEKGVIKEEDVQWILDLIEDPKASLLNIAQYLEEIKRMDLKAVNKTMLAEVMVKAHRLAYGDKIQTTNVNINVSMEEWERRLSQRLNKEQGGDDK